MHVIGRPNFEELLANAGLLLEPSRSSVNLEHMEMFLRSQGNCINLNQKVRSKDSLDSRSCRGKLRKVLLENLVHLSEIFHIAQVNPNSNNTVESGVGSIQYRSDIVETLLRLSAYPFGGDPGLWIYTHLPSNEHEVPRRNSLRVLSRRLRCFVCLNHLLFS